MKNKLTIFTLITLLISTANADIGLEFNRNGEFLPPDLFLQNKGLKDYRKGKVDDAITKLKRSAKFGNEYAKYLVANMYFEKKEWVDGYVWLLLLKEPINKSEEIKSQLEASFSQQQLQTSGKKLATLEEDYNDKSSYKRRKKWERSLKAIGSNIGGIDALTRRNTNITVPGLDVPVQPVVIRKAVKAFVLNGSNEEK